MLKSCSATHGLAYPKAVECLRKDVDFVFYALPASHWANLRPSNLTESTYATVRHPALL